jgi:DNA-binding MarR family transcriptional regulator
MVDDARDLNEDLLRSFGVITKALRQWVRAHMGAEPAITIGRAGLLLGLLERNEPVSMSALGAAHDLTPRDMTVLAAGLEREGLVRRSAHPQDRRVTLLSLTSAGRAIASEQLAPARRRAAALFDELSERDRKELLRLHGKVASHLELHGIDAPFRVHRPT